MYKGQKEEERGQESGDKDTGSERAGTGSRRFYLPPRP